MAIIDIRGVVVSATDPAIGSDPNPDLAIKAPVFAATTANITLSGLQTIDGQVLAAAARVLVKNQTTGSQNGIYNASTGNWTRSIDFASNSQVARGLRVFVNTGTVNAQTEWEISTADPITIGTTAISWSQMGISSSSLASLLSQTSSALAGTVITATSQAAFPNSRTLSSTAPITVTDSGGGAAITIGLTTPLAQSFGGTGATSFSVLTNARLSKTANYSVANADKGSTIALSGGGTAAIKTLTIPAASGLDSNFWVLVLNEDTRGWSIAPNAGTAFILWPGQSVIVFNQNNVWQSFPSFQRYAKSAGTINVDPTFGSDTNDGLSTGSAALLTIQAAVNLIQSSIDSQRGPWTIKLADGTHNTGTGVNINYGVTGSSQLLITGNISTPANVIVQCNPGGNCFNLRDGGSTVTLSGMTLHTTGNGSTLLSVSQMAVLDICGTGPVNFDNTPLGVHMDATTWASINVLGNYTINGGTAIHIRSRNAAYINYGSFTCTGASSIAITTFAVATNCGIISAGGSPMSFVGFSSSTGAKYAVTQNGIIDSSATTYPVPSAGTSATGGQFS